MFMVPCRMEPLIAAQLEQLPPVQLPSYHQFPNGDCDAYFMSEVPEVLRVSHEQWPGDRRIDYHLQMPSGY